MVALHDAAPAAEREVLRQLDQLAPLVGDRVAAAVIPAPAGGGWRDAGRTLRASLARVERLLHGHHHRTPRSRRLLGLCCGHVDEFSLLPAEEARRRLDAGQRILAEAFGRPAAGFLPPAWQAGAVDARMLAACGLRFGVGFTRLLTAGGAAHRLATFTWDFGPAAALGRLGTPLGLALLRRRGAVPVIALHPCDERRGFLRVALERVRLLLAEGFAPVTFGPLAENTPCEP